MGLEAQIASYVSMLPSIVRFLQTHSEQLPLRQKVSAILLYNPFQTIFAARKMKFVLSQHSISFWEKGNENQHFIK